MENKVLGDFVNATLENYVQLCTTSFINGGINYRQPPAEQMLKVQQRLAKYMKHCRRCYSSGTQFPGELVKSC